MGDQPWESGSLRFPGTGSAVQVGGREFWFRWSDGEGKRAVRGSARAGRHLLSLSFLRAGPSKPQSRSVPSEYRGATATS